MAAATTLSSQEQTSNFALQQYLVLQSQHEELRQHLDTIRPMTTSNTSLSSSPSVSPTRSTCSPFGQYPNGGGGKRHHSRSRRSSLSSPKTRRSSSLAPIADETTIWAVAEEEQRLFDVNEGMKRALMELLNCEQVRSDSSFRMWVQCRLMDTEKELRSERRRKSAP
ncbi:hypothetical protein CPAR01_06525 [Colletotrichum paranaense]|uniref:Uncharacterized protein n=7 Tax=Colletotrichum acutatum species complex TaxID=2707335 RepID=A0A9Q8SY71_9PEZI|nr:uncharacterized protein CLUP02_11225 [Colletotrichum lupini]XP_060349671.1 uncharacterized protein CPAR01_06525 [Colletotrichum paranaense]XP_060378255.1 uncharacterized protein CTAM01_11073 [Colletotrichum tamarilloi]KAI3532160.1 hypothetical protein CSPX01_13693 [Colletotrichum filicis]KAK0372100.1 hypothetical protein CLIM01_10548 [Colletotrichum limetticola]KAK1468450.1 hypothetical protein CMEL01_00217 [Colletotrichum melonis]KAK1489717.1 hypothetical protein CCUS01_14661 [Colletotric